MWASDRWVGACHDPSKDIVTSVDFVMSAEEVRLTQLAARVAANADCSAAQAGMTQRRANLLCVPPEPTRTPVCAYTERSAALVPLVMSVVELLTYNR